MTATSEDTNHLDEYAKHLRKEFTKNFPVQTPWSEQETAIERVSQALSEGYRIISLNAPTGSGKTWLNSAFMNKLGKNKTTVYVTPQNSLVKQITEDDQINRDYVALKGRNNYPCLTGKNNDKITLKNGEAVHLTPSDEYADKSPSVRFSQFPHQGNQNIKGYGACCNPMKAIKGDINVETAVQNACPYTKQRIKARKVLEGQTKGNILTNFSMYLSNPMFRQDPVNETEREIDLLVIDEADKMEEVAFQEATFTIGKGMFGSLNINIQDDMTKEEFYNWMTEYLLQAVSDRLQQLQDSKNSLSLSDMDEIQQLSRIKQAVQNLNIVTNDGNDLNNIILSQNEFGAYKVEPVRVERFIREKVFDHAKIVIMSSATINSHFLDHIGLDDRECKFIKTPDRRPAERKKIFYYGKDKMTTNGGKGIKDSQVDNIVEGIREILDEFPDRKGIIHCYKYDLADRIMKQLHLSHPDRVLQQDKTDKQKSLQKYLDTDKPKVFLGVANWRGLDLEGDDGRFNIIIKVPYPYLSKRAKQRERSWYVNKTATRLAQATGRTTRKPDDWSATFILDKKFKAFYRDRKGYFPTWFDVEKTQDVSTAIQSMKQEIKEKQEI